MASVNCKPGEQKGRSISLFIGMVRQTKTNELIQANWKGLPIVETGPFWKKKIDEKEKKTKEI